MPTYLNSTITTTSTKVHTIPPVYIHAHSVTQSCLTLCDPMDCGPPGFSVHGISQARILEWVVISSSRGSSRPRCPVLNGTSPRSLPRPLHLEIICSAISLLIPPYGSNRHLAGLAVPVRLGPKANITGAWPAQSHEALHLASRSAVAVLQLLMIYKSRVLQFHFALGCKLSTQSC